jgi:hypothetical protein
MASATKPSWAAIVGYSSITKSVPSSSPVEEHNHVVTELPPQTHSSSVINIHLKAESGWIVGRTDESPPQTFIPSQLFHMFPYLRKRLFAHVYTRDSWPEPGGMYGFYARPGVTQKTYTFEGNTYIIDFSGLQVGDH